jgi:tRNA 2-selenouridine synthase
MVIGTFTFNFVTRTMASSTVSDLSSLFLNDTPMLDVRAPVEFAQGAFPSATNLPLMTDEEREAVGIQYKQHGQDAAIELGHSLVRDETKAERVNAWRAFFEQHPNGVLYCFRGGLRSRVTQQWLEEAGLSIPFVEGGYKAMRRFLLEFLQTRIAEENITILSGPTGSGKTDVIEQWHRSVDLEGIANHRGSAFGKTHKPQPSQIDFENRWAIDWMKLMHHGDGPVLFEDESRLIGRIAVIPEFLALSKQANAIVLKAPLEERIARIRKDYFVDHFERAEGDALASLNEFVGQALFRIRKRLGGDRYQQLTQMLEMAITALTSQNQWERFDDLIASLLNDYYDPMYHYQFQQKQPRVLFEGSHSEILQWLAQKQHH